MFAQILGVVAPVFLMAGIGFVLNRCRVKLETEALGRLILLVGTPALVFSSLTSEKMMQVPVSEIIQSAIFAVICAGVLGAVFLIAIRQSVRAFLSSMALPNTGNLGLSVVLLAFGDEGLGIGAAFFLVIALSQYTLVPAIMDGGFTFQKILREPLLYAIAISFAFRLTDTIPHQILIDTTRIMGGMVIPVMVILLGNSLAGLQVSDLKLSVVLSFGRLIIGTLTGLAAIYLFDLSGIAAGSVFLMSTMPCAMVIYLFAIRYNKAPRRIAGLIVVSTLMTFAALPVLLWVGIGLSQGQGPLESILQQF